MDGQVTCSPGKRAFAWFLLRSFPRFLITLGIYRFWYLTGRRRFFWSSTKLEGDAFEYTGRGSELLVGFMIAIVILGAYSALINVLITLVSFTHLYLLFSVGILASIPIIPLIYLARYSAWRYLFSRTTWRGVRFGMERGAWGYAWRGCVGFLLAALTLGLLVPYITLWLDRYRLTRSWFGNEKFSLDVSARKMMLPWLALWVLALFPAICLAMLFAVVGLTGDLEIPGSLAGEADAGEGVDGHSLLLGSVVGLTVSLLLLFLAVSWWKVAWLRFLFRHLRLGANITFSYNLKFWRVVWTYCSGAFLICVSLLLFVSPIALYFTDFDVFIEYINNIIPEYFLVITPFIIVVFYLTFLFVAFFCFEFFIRRRMTKLYVSRLKVIGVEHADAIRQRAAARAREAGGFADALDVGGLA